MANKKPLCDACRVNLQTLGESTPTAEVVFDHKRNSLLILGEHAFEIPFSQLENLSKMHRAKRRKAAGAGK